MRHYLVGDVAYSENNKAAVNHGIPVVVINPDDAEQVDRLVTLFWAHSTDDCNDPAAMQTALREFVKPPALVEPTETGARVVDPDGNVWTRIEGWPDGPWAWGPNLVGFEETEAVQVLA